MNSPAIGGFEKWLSVWVALAILLGILSGQLFPALFAMLAGLEYAHVNMVVAVLIWAMVYPMMISVDFASIAHVAEQPRGLVITLVINWLVKPFTMAALGVLFFKFVFAGLMAPSDANSYLAGLILLGAAPCTAMVFVWSQLTRGDANYTLVQVSVNDLIMVFAYAPIVALLLGVTDIPVPWDTLVISVVLYIVVPLAAGMASHGPKQQQYSGGFQLYRPAEAILDYWPVDNGCAAVRVSGQRNTCATAADRSHCNSAFAAILRYIRHFLRRGLALAGSVSDCRSLRHDRNVKLF